VWSYEEVETGWKGGRSEGLAVASYAMFVKGYFSSDPNMPYQVDGELRWVKGWVARADHTVNVQAKRFLDSIPRAWQRSFRLRRLTLWTALWVVRLFSSS
jgi:hypothetical protein